MQPALQDEPRRSRWVCRPSVTEHRPKIGPQISGQATFRYPQTSDARPLREEMQPRPLREAMQTQAPAGVCWRHELALEFVCRAEFWCNRHCKTSHVDLDGFAGQVLLSIGQKSAHRSSARQAMQPRPLVHISYPIKTAQTGSGRSFLAPGTGLRICLPG